MSSTSRTDSVSFDTTSHSHFQFGMNNDASFGLTGSTFNLSQDKNLFLGEPTFNDPVARISPFQECHLETIDHSAFLSPLSDSILTSTCRVGEAELFMHYLDQVFYIQFPFYDASATSKGRGWLFSLLGRVKPLYHAALALSQFHQDSLVPRNNANANKFDRLKCKEEYYTLTLQELHLSTGGSMCSRTTDLICTIEDLICVLQLLFFEVCHIESYNTF
jgi:hypothetical protein